MKPAPETTKNIFLIVSWATYDLANQLFALNIISLYFVSWLVLDKHAPEILYSIAFGISTFFIAISAPILGAISDLTNRRRPFLVFFTLLSVVFTMFLGTGSVTLALVFFAIANFGCQTATVFYNAMMINITPKNKTGLVSGIGKMFSYSGAIVALYLVKSKNGYQATFFPTGLAFLILALPCMLFITDKPPLAKIGFLSFFKKQKIREISNNLKETLFNVQCSLGLLDFLKASFFVLCSVNAVILFMSIYASKVFGLNGSQVRNLLIFSTLFAMAGSIFSGFISDYLGHKFCLGITFILWGVGFFAGTFAKSLSLYWVIGAVVGVALGATWTVSRAMAIELVPQEKIGEVFGLFNLIGYLSAIVGALVWGLIPLIFSSFGEWSHRMALFCQIPFILLGFIYLMRIPNIKRHG